MVTGAFKYFRHEHHFKKTAAGTLMIDIFAFESPLGILGKLANVLFLKKYMQQLLIKRNEAVKHLAESGEGSELLLARM